MIYSLDTNTCIYLINGRSPSIFQRLSQQEPEDVVLSSIVVSELMFGAANSQFVERNYATIEAFIAGYYVVPFDLPSSRAYGELRAYLRKSGKPIGNVDTLIAAHALTHELTLITNNTKQFSRVPRLRIEDWTVNDA